LRKIPIAAAAILLAVGCADGSEEEIELRPGVLDVGVLVAPGSDLGRTRAIANGARIAVQEYNALGGVGGALRLRLVVGSERALRRQGVQHLILPCAGERLPSPRSIATAACGRAARRVVAAAMSASAQGAALAEYADQEGAETIAVPTPNGGRERRVRAALEAAAAERGITIVDEPAAADVRVGLAAPVTGEAPADSVEGTVYATYGLPEPGDELDELLERHRFLLGVRASTVEPALGFDALRVLALALEEAGVTAPAAVAAEVRQGLQVRGAFGEIEYPGGTTRPELRVAIVGVHDGRLELVEWVDEAG
jgi:ABC-type branched-subunit amino acid transport system substrate-binding protein